MNTKCYVCGSEMVHRGAFDTVDGVKRKAYVCVNKMCLHVKLGEKMEAEG